MSTVLTPQEMREFIVKNWEDDAPAVIAQINRWLARGDKAAVYVNVDLGHPEVGMPKIVSYGSPAAQLEVPEPPDRLPDLGNQINYRFWLEHTCTEGPIPSE